MKLKYKKEIALTLLAIVLTVILFFDGKHRSKSLEQSKYNIAIVHKFWRSSRAGYNISVFHEVNSQRIKSKVFRAKKCRNLKAGDTILVFYSLSDPSIVDISQCFWKPEFMDSIGLKSNQIVKNDWLE